MPSSAATGRARRTTLARRGGDRLLVRVHAVRDRGACPCRWLAGSLPRARRRALPRRDGGRLPEHGRGARAPGGAGATRRRSPWRRRRPTSAGPTATRTWRCSGRLTVGQVLLQEGRREEALACLDEVMLTVSTGDLYPTVAGLGVLRGDRRSAWACSTSPAHRSGPACCPTGATRRPGSSPSAGSCLVHRSQIKAMRGDWAGALDEARRRATYSSAGRRATRGTSSARSTGCTGAYPEAEDAYRQANSLGRQPEPGLALMRLAQGRVDEAVTTFRRLHAEPDRLDRADVLAGYVETMLATGDVDAAEAAADELEPGVGSTSPLMYRPVPPRRGRPCSSLADDGAGGLACLRPALEGVARASACRTTRRGCASGSATACRLLGDDELRRPGVRRGAGGVQPARRPARPGAPRPRRRPAGRRD